MSDTREPVHIRDLALGDLFIDHYGHIYVRGGSYQESPLRRMAIDGNAERFVSCAFYDLHGCGVFGWNFHSDDLVYRPNEDELAKWKLYCDEIRAHYEKSRVKQTRCLTFMQAIRALNDGLQIRRPDFCALNGEDRITFVKVLPNKIMIARNGIPQTERAYFSTDDIDAIDWEIAE